MLRFHFSNQEFFVKSSMKTALLAFVLCGTSALRADDGMSQSVRGILSLGGLALTGAAVKFISSNETTGNLLGKAGVMPKEAALLLGTMGGFFSLSSSVPAVSSYGWLVPVAWGSFRLATTGWFRKLVNGIPQVGEHLMGDETIQDFDMLKKGGEITENNAAKKESRARAAIFAPLFVAMGLYVPLKYLLEHRFNYPGCMVDLTGRGVNTVANWLTVKA